VIANYLLRNLKQDVVTLMLTTDVLLLSTPLNCNNVDSLT